MQIEYKTGNALKGPERYTVHGCNARGVMGRGIALEVKRDFRPAYDAYRAAFLELDDPEQGLELGRTIWAHCGSRTIINAVTQRDYQGGPEGTVYVDYDAIGAAMRQIDRQARDRGIDRVAMPLIGAGLAGGSWQTIAWIIEGNTKHFQPVVYLLDGVIPET